MRVAEFLNGEHIAFETLLHAPAYTAQHRAKYLGVSGNHVAKAVLLRGQEGYLLAVFAGYQANRYGCRQFGFGQSVSA